VKYFPSESIWDWQAWPQSPEGNFIGPIVSSDYLGVGTPTPFFNGQRQVWRDSPTYTYGFMNSSTPQSVYDNYHIMIENAADVYKENFWKYRNFSVAYHPYAFGVVPSINPLAIWRDQENTCPGTQFYTGFDFADYAASYTTEDNSIVDCVGSEANPVNLTYGETANNFPDSPSLRAAQGFLNRILLTMLNYYDGLDPGCNEVFNITVQTNDLEPYNVTFGGDISPEGLMNFAMALRSAVLGQP
jgi:hypothetical protein